MPTSPVTPEPGRKPGAPPEVRDALTRAYWVHGRFRFTAVFIAVYLTGSLAILGFVAVAAASPVSHSVTFGVPPGGGVWLVRFTPPSWGTYEIHVAFPGHSGCAEFDCQGFTVYVYGCADPACAAPSVPIVGCSCDPYPGFWTGPTTESLFAVNISGNNLPSVLVVSTDYFTSGAGGPGFATGGPSLLPAASWLAISGTIGLAVSIAVWRYAPGQDSRQYRF